MTNYISFERPSIHFFGPKTLSSRGTSVCFFTFFPLLYFFPQYRRKKISSYHEITINKKHDFATPNSQLILQYGPTFHDDLELSHFYDPLPRLSRGNRAVATDFVMTTHSVINANSPATLQQQLRTSNFLIRRPML